MVEVNFNTKTISFNVVLFGPPECGKKTWIEYMHRQLPKPNKMQEEVLENEKSMSFSYKSWQETKIERFYHAMAMKTCSLDIQKEPRFLSKTLESADGIIFIADSSTDKEAQNIEHLDFLFEQMRQSGRELTSDKLDADLIDSKWYSLGQKELKTIKVPWVLSFNKRDLSNCMSLAQMESDLKRENVFTCESVAKDGLGIFGALKYVSHALIDGVHKRKSWWEGLEEESGGN